ncbi:hypothetical protein LguiA_007394 [Lonicera macranthoides]
MLERTDLLKFNKLCMAWIASSTHLLAYTHVRIFIVSTGSLEISQKAQEYYFDPWLDILSFGKAYIFIYDVKCSYLLDRMSLYV